MGGCFLGEIFLRKIEVFSQGRNDHGLKVARQETSTNPCHGGNTDTERDVFFCYFGCIFSYKNRNVASSEPSLIWAMIRMAQQIS